MLTALSRATAGFIGTDKKKRGKEGGRKRKEKTGELRRREERKVSEAEGRANSAVDVEIKLGSPLDWSLTTRRRRLSEVRAPRLH